MYFQVFFLKNQKSFSFQQSKILNIFATICQNKSQLDLVTNWR
jgi:hypothetical protein